MERIKKKRILKIVLITAAALLVLSVAGFAAVQALVINTAGPAIKPLDELEPADAVLVLGARVYEDGTPSHILQYRLDYGLAVYEAGLVPKIIVSGDHGNKDYNEVRAMKQYLLDRGVPKEDIFMDHAGFDTYDSMYRARDVFCVQSLIVSTQRYHLYRSVYIAKQLGLEVQGYAAPDITTKKLYNNLRESLARVKAVLDVDLLHRSPKYLGEAIPISGSGLETEDGLSDSPKQP